jgi:hypothetical protein
MSAAHLSRIDRLKQLEACLPVEGPPPDLCRVVAAQTRKAAALYGINYMNDPTELP